MSARRMKWELVDKVLVLVQGEGVASDVEWNAFLDDYDKQSTLLQSMLWHLPSIGPSSAQRRRLSEIHARHPLAIAVLTNSQLARGAVTALSWLGVTVKTFDPAQEEAALTHLGLSPRTRELLLKQLASLRRELTGTDRGMTA